MAAASGKLLDTSDAVVDVSALAATLISQLAGAGIKVAAVLDTGGNPFSVRKSAALEDSGIIKAAAGTLYGLSGRIDSTAPSATYYLQILDSATLPADGAVTHLIAPIKIVVVTGTDYIFDLDFTPNGIAAAAGIVVCLSSTEFTKTISSAYLSTTGLYS